MLPGQAKDPLVDLYCLLYFVSYLDNTAFKLNFNVVETKVQSDNLIASYFICFQCSFFVIQRLNRHYKEPEEFRPERFAKSEPR